MTDTPTPVTPAIVPNPANFSSRHVIHRTCLICGKALRSMGQARAHLANAHLYVLTEKHHE
ncbi:hypothetical protein [Hyphobacterium sp.]|uniref:hypothetical protein n=1 Tax=Hyphobacterium sp. TaxID=2004662 RepID=UPI003B526EB7